MFTLFVCKCTRICIFMHASSFSQYIAIYSIKRFMLTIKLMKVKRKMHSHGKVFKVVSNLK